MAPEEQGSFTTFPFPSPKQTARVCRHLRHLTISQDFAAAAAAAAAWARPVSSPGSYPGEHPASLGWGDKTLQCSLIGWA